MLGYNTCAVGFMREGLGMRGLGIPGGRLPKLLTGVMVLDLGDANLVCARKLCKSFKL
jgi:hypothetical protein